ELARKNAHVFMLGRNLEGCQAVIEKIKSETASQPARIVNVSSRGHAIVAGIEFEKLNDPNAQDPTQRYAQSKLAIILSTNELNKRYLEGEQVYANSLHP
ncbi:24690_t:CDS:2, partial [Dentiscutata erythropus]